MGLAQKVLLHVYQHWHAQLLQHILYLTSNITYVAPSGLNLSVTGKGWVNGKLTFPRNCSLPLRLSQGISIAALFCCARFILRVCVDRAQIMEVMCGVRGYGMYLLLSQPCVCQNCFHSTRGKTSLHPHFWVGKGLSGVRGQSSIVQLSLKRVLSRQGTRHNSGVSICSCLHACSISFIPLWILPCGILGFSLSWGAADYCKEAAWQRFGHSQTSRIRLAFPVSTVEWEAVNPARCKWLYIGIT